MNETLAKIGVKHFSLAIHAAQKAIESLDGFRYTRTVATLNQASLVRLVLPFGIEVSKAESFGIQ